MTGRIYALIDPRSKQIRYVGKTIQTLRKRLIGHVTETHRGTYRRARWIRALERLGIKPRIVALGTYPTNDLCEQERRWISILRKWGADLVNSTAGGDGVEFTTEIRDKIAKAMRGRTHEVRQETRDKIRAALKGRSLNTEQREKLRQAALGRVLSPEARIKISAANKGKIVSKETRAKLSAANFRRWARSR